MPARWGATEEAEQHARLAEQAAASLDDGQERVYAAMARALVCQACIRRKPTTRPLQGDECPYLGSWSKISAHGGEGSRPAGSAESVRHRLGHRRALPGVACGRAGARDSPGGSRRAQDPGRRLWLALVGAYLAQGPRIILADVRDPVCRRSFRFAPSRR